MAWIKISSFILFIIWAAVLSVFLGLLMLFFPLLHKKSTREYRTQCSWEDADQ